MGEVYSDIIDDYNLHMGRATTTAVLDASDINGSGTA